MPPDTLLLDAILTYIYKFLSINNTCDSTKHICTIRYITYIHIKAYQLTHLGLSNTSPHVLCLFLAHVNHWVDQIVKLPHSAVHSHCWPFRSFHNHTPSPLLPIPSYSTTIVTLLTPMSQPL